MKRELTVFTYLKGSTDFRQLDRISSAWVILLGPTKHLHMLMLVPSNSKRKIPTASSPLHSVLLLPVNYPRVFCIEEKNASTRIDPASAYGTS